MAFLDGFCYVRLHKPVSADITIYMFELYLKGHVGSNPDSAAKNKS